jgi:hypothetical protein
MAFLERNANRGSVSTKFRVDNSLKMDHRNSENFYRDNPTAGNRRTFTISLWTKIAGPAQDVGDPYIASQGSNARFHYANNTLRFMFDGNSTELEAPKRLRDVSAWYHIVLAVDTTQSTASNRVKAYVNGEAYGWSNTKYPSQNAESDWMNTNDMYFNVRDGDNSYNTSNYMAEVAVIDGTQYAASDFGEFDEDSGIWKCKDFKDDVTFGSQGFYLKFDDSSDIGADSSGNSNDVTLNNITAADIALDTPTNNFCTLEGHAHVGNQYGRYVQRNKEGNTQADEPTGSFGGLFGSHSFTSGKWYWEIKQYYTNSVNLQDFGVTSIKNTGSQEDGSSGFHVSEPAEGLYPDATAGIYPQAGGTTSYAHGTSSSANDNLGAAANGKIFQIAFDADNGKIWFGANDTWQDTIGGTQPSKADIAAGNNARYDDLNDYKEGPWIPCFGMYNANEGHHMDVNFGGYTAATPSSGNSDQNGYGNFEYEPPSGFLAICSENLGAETTIDDPSAHFQTKLYTGNGSTQSITFDGNSNLHPDILLLKSQNDGHSWWLVNSTLGPTKGVYPDNPNYGPLTSDSGKDVTDFTSNGFALGVPQHANSTNSSSAKVAYAWHANSGSNNVTDTSQNISATVQVNTIAKQAVGTYSGSSADADVVGHGLGVKPHMIWVRANTRVENIRVYEFGGETTNGGMSITDTNAQVNDSTNLLTTPPTATAMSFGTDLSVGGNGHTYTFYAWGEVAGYSYFGKYEGNGYHNTAGTYPTGKDGPFIHTGFAPAFIMIKRSDTSGSWTIYDNARDDYNSSANSAIFLNSTTSDSSSNISGANIDWFSNGFKVKSTDNTVNQAGGQYAVMAFAARPQQTSTGVPATGR